MKLQTILVIVGVVAICVGGWYIGGIIFSDSTKSGSQSAATIDKSTNETNQQKQTTQLQQKSTVPTPLPPSLVTQQPLVTVTVNQKQTITPTKPNEVLTKNNVVIISKKQDTQTSVPRFLIMDEDNNIYQVRNQQELIKIQLHKSYIIDYVIINNPIRSSVMKEEFVNIVVNIHPNED